MNDDYLAGLLYLDWQWRYKEQAILRTANSNNTSTSEYTKGVLDLEKLEERRYYADTRLFEDVGELIGEKRYQTPGTMCLKPLSICLERVPASWLILRVGVPASCIKLLCWKDRRSAGSWA